ncbi:PIN domain-containing protein [Rhodopseudomonas sp. B29]|uniref:type II toxin-antitoxin system VapC family toxin n=1 Tax=Rhodopseudomonas sp. B29 TaxID=95607 RepID=UPI0003B77DD3|nr:PIN domain-containing protein [Rhodopseudomonas sp. B29]
MPGLVYLDTNLFINAVEGTVEAGAPARRLIAFLRADGRRLAVTSEITFAEVLAPAKRPDALTLEIKRRVYLDLLLWSKVVGLVPVSREILIDTADLRLVAPLKLPDAIHLKSAIAAGCEFFVTSDEDFNRLPVGMKRVNCESTEIDQLISELS